MHPGEFSVELIGRIRGVKSGKKALFLQTKGLFARQSNGSQIAERCFIPCLKYPYLFFHPRAKLYLPIYTLFIRIGVLSVLAILMRNILPC